MAESVSEALGRFTEILGKQTARLELEEQKERAKISATRITDAFSKISPLHDEEDARQIMLDTITDASALETLDTQMPLISSLYNNSVQAIQNYKARKQDELLKGYTASHGYDGPGGLSGATQMEVLQYEQSRERAVNYTDEEGKAFLRVYDAHGNLSKQYDVDERGDQYKLDMELKTIAATERERARWRDRADYVMYAGTTPEGLPISFNKQENKFYVPYTDPNSGNVTMRPYGGEVMRGTQSSLTEAIKQQKLWAGTTKELWKQNEGMAQDVLNRLGVQLPMDPSYKNVATSNFMKLKNMTEEEIDKAIIDAGLEGEDVQTVRDKITSMKEVYSQYDAAAYEGNRASDTMTYETALKTYKLTPQEYNTYYNSARQIIANTSQYPQISQSIRDIVAESLGLKQSEIKSASETQWQTWFDQLGNVGSNGKKGKGYIMSELRNKLTAK